MAKHYYAMELGEKPGDVTTNTSTQNKTAEVVIELADGATQAEVVTLINTLRDTIEQGPWPPA